MKLRIPFMMLAILNLLAGLWAGLLRMGWELPLTPVAAHHGAIMVGGFLTTLIILEKVVPLKRNLLLAIPMVSALSLLIVLPGSYHPGLVFLMAGSAGLFAVLGYYLYLYPRDLSAGLMLMGAGCLLIGNVMLIQKQLYMMAFPWWMGFLLLTITAERLELSKFLPVSSDNKLWLLGFLGLFLAGLLMPFHGPGKYLSGTALAAVAVWMLKFDVIRVGLRKEGLTRFSSLALALANGWLILEGLLLMLLPELAYSYDMLVHVFFIGFVFSMIFAHGPVILPGVLGIVFRPYHAILYVWLFLLDGSLLLRVAADATGQPEWRKIAGILAVAGILLYFMTLVVLVVRNELNAAKKELR